MSALVTRISDLATRIATAIKANRTLINGNAADLSSLTTTNKTNLVAALNELRANVQAIVPGAQINDAAAGTTTTYSSQKIVDLISAAISSLTSGAPGALDTLDELAAALGDDANFAGTVTTALANRVRFDAAQTLTATQKAQAKTNIDAYGSAEIGNPDTDFVAVFNAGLA
jgi:capsid protein